MAHLAQLPHLTAAELDVLADAVVARADELHRPGDGVSWFSGPALDLSPGEQRLVLYSLLTAISEARMSLDRSSVDG